MATCSHMIIAGTNMLAIFISILSPLAFGTSLRRRHLHGDGNAIVGKARVKDSKADGRPSKPELMLTFQMLARSASGSIANISADAARCAISVVDATPPKSVDIEERRQLPRDGSVMDFRKGHEFQRQRFFDELVCYLHDLGGHSHAKAANHTANGSLDRKLRGAFVAAVGQALEAPLHLYDNAEFAGVDTAAGVRCSLWRAQVRTGRPLAQLMQEATSGGKAALGVTLGSPGAAVLPTPEELHAAILKSGYAAGAAAASADAKDAELDEQASFCVTESGALVAANSSREVVIQVRRNASATPMRFPLWSFAAQMVAESAPDPSPGAAAFDGTLGIAGGRCIDLTRGSTGEKELEVHLNSEDRIERINHEARGHWRAGVYDLWEGVTVRQVMPSLGARLGPLSLPLGADSAGSAADADLPPLMLLGVSRAAAPANATLRASTLPVNFDGRKRWPQCQSIGFIRNQGAPKSKTVDAAALLQEDAVAGLALSPEHLVDCDVRNSGCNGGRLDDAWWYLRDHGVPSETCAPYKYCPNPTEPGCALGRARGSAGRGSSNRSPTCGGACASGGAMQVFKAAAVYAVSKPGDIAALQRELMTRGSVEVGFFVFSDFHSYQDGVYFRTPGAFGPLGGHAVRLIGWGTSESTYRQPVDYWVAANSWSPVWGLGGFFRIRRGTNECGIETTPAAGLPALVAEAVVAQTQSAVKA
mmetsp:Transcript_125982/g.362297  ORF Transcript_125982/g.362297 Transcript_125982/m.362297 type:complete len:705 (-) Transcript_125982:8-2122(-)